MACCEEHRSGQICGKSSIFLIADHWRMVSFIAESVRISTGSVHSIFAKNVWMRKVSARCECCLTFRRQNALTRRICSASVMKIQIILFHDSWLQMRLASSLWPKSKMQSMDWKHAISLQPRQFYTSNVTGGHWRPKQKLWASYRVLSLKQTSHVAIRFLRQVRYRALSLHYACIRSPGIILIP